MLFQTLVSSGLLASLITAVVEAKYPISPLTTGVDPTTGARPFRNNIIDLYQKAGPTWDLYIQALTTMQNTPEDDLLSYFQIAGIHGRPYYSWDGYEHNPDAPEIGYCTHGNVLFPTWHRPYLALFEKILYDNAQKIAKTYTSNLAVYQAAADNFRMPYWDWPTIPTMPEAITLPTVKISTPSGQREVKNPNFEYRFLNFPLNDTWFPSTSDNLLSTYNSTKRSPSDGVSNNGAANNNLAGAGLMKDTYDVFAKITDFNTMATGSTAGRSFEYVHNKVHTGIGGGGGFVSLGHMSAVSYSAFDPVFWLHHTNVDRLFALWEAVNPKSFLATAVDTTGTFTIPIGSNDTVSSPLTPFTMGDGTTPFTSTTSRFTKDFGYAYPEILDWTMNEGELKKNVTAWINTHWAPATTTKIRRRVGNVGRAGKESREWSVGIKALDTAFEEERYVVEVSIKGQKIGEMQVVPPAAAMEGRLGNVNSTTNYEVDLDDVLVASAIDIEDVGAVTSFLKDGLEWSAKKSDSVTVPGRQVPGLVITVSDVLVTPAADLTEFPHYGLSTSHPEVTIGK